MSLARRVLEIRRGDLSIPVTIDVEPPRAGPDGGWFCAYVIDWPDDARHSAGWGVDAVQAIFLTFEKIGIELYTSAYHEAGELVWLEPGSGYGFPVPANARSLLVGDDLRFFGGAD